MPSHVSNLEAYAERLRKPSRIDRYHTKCFRVLSRSYVEFPRHTKSIISKNKAAQLYPVPTAFKPPSPRSSSCTPWRLEIADELVKSSK